MCELFGASLNDPISINGLLAEFFSHSVMHPHGWGLATFSKDSQQSSILTEPIRAIDSQVLKQRLLKEVNENVVLGHIRYATIGKICNENCHPYTAKDRFNRQWTLIHNGTIYSGTQLLPYIGIQKGNTDSERILLYIINKVNLQNTNPTSYERFHILDTIVCEISYRNKLNLIIFDGEQLYVHTNMEKTLYQKEQNGNIFFSTTPLDNFGWSPVQMNTLLVFKDSSLKYVGKSHNHTFVDTINKISSNHNYYI